MGDKEWEAIRRLSERLDRLQQELWALKARKGLGPIPWRAP